MSSQEQDSPLQRWLPKLAVYRTALDESNDLAAEGLRATASGERNFSLRIYPNSLSHEVQPSGANATQAVDAAPQSAVSQSVAPQIVHLPIDGILKRMAKVKSFVLGVGTVGEFEASLVRKLTTDIVDRCCEKTLRKAILVSIRPSDSPQPQALHPTASFREVQWTCMGSSRLETKLWHSQLAQLPLWKKDFGLIVFDLGDVCLPMMPRVGRLCDGIVVQMVCPTDSRESIRALKSLQKERLPILGAWSVDFSARELAA